jgi:hypothetical protein
MSDTPPTSPPPNERVAEPTKVPSAPRGPGRRRSIAIGVLLVVVLAAVVVGVVLFLNRGDGTKRTANPIEVRRLVATFACTPDNPTTPENLRLTAGQEVVKVPRAGCAVVGEVVGRVDRLQKVESKTSGGTCTVTLSAPAEYGRIVDQASSVSDGQARALVAGGWLLDVRAVIDYPGRPSDPLNVTFSAPDPAACTAVSDALALQ